MIGGLIRKPWTTPLCAVCLLLTTQCVLFAFENPLSEETIREAYFLGRSSDFEKLQRFQEQYARHPKGNVIGEINLRTPYELAVLRSLKNGNYNAQQAQLDYRAQRDAMLLSIAIYPPGYSQMASPNTDANISTRNDQIVDEWHGFRLLVSQEHAIKPNVLRSRPIYSRDEIIGAEIVLEFDASQFAPKLTKVQIVSPGGLTDVEEFDLATLK